MAGFLKKNTLQLKNIQVAIINKSNILNNVYVYTTKHYAFDV